MIRRFFPLSVELSTKQLVLRLAASCALGLLMGSPLAAQTESSESVAGETPPEESLQIHTVPKIDLGYFEIKNLEPTRNLTSKVAFGMHLTLRDDVSEQDLEAVQKWKNRLREQVLVAVRMAEIVDFLDPKLLRFRRSILYRVNRLLKPVKVEDVLLADFTFSAG